MSQDVTIEIEHGLGPDEATAVLESLPDWFGRPEAIADYAREAGRLTAVTARRGRQLAGFLTLKRQTSICEEIAVMAVRPEWRRQGMGRQLVERAGQHVQGNGARLILVQTVGPSHEDAACAEPRAFYEAAGFLPVIEIAEHSGDGMPALLMVHSLTSLTPRA